MRKADVTRPADRSSDGFTSWGGARAAGAIPSQAADFAWQGTAGPALPFGNGRSYGDSCLAAGATMIDSRGSARVLAFDPVEGRLTAQAGILLSEIIAHVASAGWFLPVVPGTQFVTLGGAIANDIHGKNHHRRGTFGCHVESLVLDRSDRSPVRCTPEENADLFAATISGMGLTGLIREATIRLMKVPSLSIDERTLRFDRLADYFDLAPEADERHEYAVAWIDSLSAGDAFGRGHLIAGDHAATGERSGRARPPLASVPLTPPVSPLIGPALRLFNETYYRKAPRGESRRTVPFDGFFFPLDRIGRWNRLYGPRGLHQHQSVVPDACGPEAVGELLACARAHRQGSFLTVLKRFGALASPGLTSFPRPGYTLTLDFPHRGEKTLRLLADLDRITIAAGGAVNPYKDGRMSAQTFAAGFERWERLEALRDPACVSDFWRRTGLALTGARTVAAPARAAEENATAHHAFTLDDENERSAARMAAF